MRYPWLGDISLACYTCCVVIFLSAISSSLERTSTVFSKCSQIQFHFEKLKRGNSETSHQKTKRTTEGWDLIFRVDVCILLLGHICMLLSFHCYTNSFLHLVVFSTSERAFIRSNIGYLSFLALAKMGGNTYQYNFGSEANHSARQLSCSLS